MPRELQGCGTWGAYQAHLRRDEPVDRACREACRVRSAEYRAANLKKVRAREAKRRRQQRAYKKQREAADA